MSRRKQERPAKPMLMEMTQKEYHAYLKERQALSDRLAKQNAAFYKAAKAKKR